MFRKEALIQTEDRLSGDIFVEAPVSWQILSYSIFGAVFVGFLFLFFATYSRVEIAAGTVVPDKGVAAILPTRSGTITSLFVSDGQDITAGAELAAVRAEEDTSGGLSAAQQIEAAIGRQDASLAAQMHEGRSASTAQLRQIAAQRSGLSAEIDQLESQIALQRSLIASAQSDYDGALKIFERGFLSRRDILTREETLLSRRQGVSQLIQALATKRAAFAEAEKSAVQIDAEARAQDASLAASRAEIAQQAASTAGLRSYVLRAPVAGRVTALTARAGQPANPQTPLMAIVPAESQLRAELAVPSSAIGFVRPGQEVRLAIDSFPYQRFGTIKGRVSTVASSTVSTQGPNGATVSAYPVVVTLDQSTVSAFGRAEPLVSGMSLTARIVIEKQSLLQWLFQPLFAVQRRHGG